jgi:hypothetical protein
MGGPFLKMMQYNVTGPQKVARTRTNLSLGWPETEA